MRTKTIILSGLLAALSGASLMADGVYSLNAVGYINVDLPSGQFVMIADQLLYGGPGVANTLSPMLDSQLTNGTAPNLQFFKYQGGSYTIAQISGGGTTWAGGAQNTMTLNPGEGIFVYNPNADMQLTFVGTVPQGNVTNTACLTSGFSMISSVVPQAGTLDVGNSTSLNFTPNNQDNIFIYQGGSYTVYIANSANPSGWAGATPSVNVGQAFYYYTTNPNGMNWVRTFNVN